MKKSILLIIAVSIFISIGCHYQKTGKPGFSIKENYYKKEFRIPMRDGKTLFTAVYIPKDSSQNYPIMLMRTPYSVGPYGEDKFKRSLGPSKEFAEQGYIFAYQDVRGKFMSEGKYVNMRPHIENKKSNQDVDESSDTYDTIDWLVKNIPHNNGKVGMWGISYPGFYTSMGLIDAHPALKAASPQAPIADWFIDDDMHHNGALTLVMTFNFFSVFGLQHNDTLYNKWPKRFKHGTPDGYRFFLELGPLSNVNKKYFHNEIPFWNEVMKHGTYDDFWKKRNILPHLTDIKPAVMVVGGWFDMEDLYGPLHTYQAIEKTSRTKNHLVMGPWYHGGWARSDGERFGDINFGSKTGVYFRQNLQLPFFNYYLKGIGKDDFAEATCFDTGEHQWHSFEQWPPKNLKQSAVYLQPDGQLTFSEPAIDSLQYDEYWSDPDHPVPYINKIINTREKTYMISDQRFAATRPDVLVYETDILHEDVTMAGQLTAALYVSTSGTDCDFVVKVIDVYPDTSKDNEPNPCKVRMGGYQQLVRGSIMRAKFREDYSNPKPMVPNEITEISIPLQDVFHTFKKGHRIMVQIQSSWFPLFDRNPQKFTDIYSAKEEDFQKALQKVYFNNQYPSQIRFSILKEKK